MAGSPTHTEASAGALHCASVGAAALFLSFFVVDGLPARTVQLRDASSPWYHQIKRVANPAAHTYMMTRHDTKEIRLNFFPPGFSLTIEVTFFFFFYTSLAKRYQVSKVPKKGRVVGGDSCEKMCPTFC